MWLDEVDKKELKIERPRSINAEPVKINPNKNKHQNGIPANVVRNPLPRVSIKMLKQTETANETDDKVIVKKLSWFFFNAGINITLEYIIIASEITQGKLNFYR